MAGGDGNTLALFTGGSDTSSGGPNSRELARLCVLGGETSVWGGIGTMLSPSLSFGATDEVEAWEAPSEDSDRPVLVLRVVGEVERGKGE